MIQNEKTEKERNTLIKNLLLEAFKEQNNDEIIRTYKYFIKKYEQDIKQYGIIIAIKIWLKDVANKNDALYNDKILKLAKDLGYINLTDKEKEEFIEIYFLVIALQVYKIFKKLL